MQLNLYNIKGEKLSKKVTLDPAVFEARVSKYLLGLSVYIYLKNQRAGTAKTKTRGEVRGGGAKPWRQKGTGRARHGSIRSPIWKGGGVVFGPTNERIYKRKMTKKMKKNAIRSALSYFAKNGKIIILENVDLNWPRYTKQVLDIIENLKCEGNVIFIHKNSDGVYLGTRNLKNVECIRVNEINVYKLLWGSRLIIFENALEEIKSIWGSSKSSIIKNGNMKVKKVNNKDILNHGNDKEINESNLNKRIVNALKKANIKTKNELIDILSKGEPIQGIGSKSVLEIKKVLNIK